MIVLDTDAISNLMAPRPSAELSSRLAAIPFQQQSTTAITVGELAYGAYRAGRPELYDRAMHLLTGTEVLPFDQPAAEEYGRIRSELERHGRPLADPDLRIAAIVLSRGATLVSGNIRHFSRISGLSVENWLAVSG